MIWLNIFNMDIEKTFQQSCRICTQHHDVGVMIFSDQGKKMLLRDTILDYLTVEVVEEDELPKMICLNCCTRLDAIKIFVNMAQESQLKLKQHLELINYAKKSSMEEEESQEMSIKQDWDDEDDEEDEYEEDAINGAKVESSDVTEMEVRLDPMMFLDCQTDDSQTNDCFSNNKCKQEILPPVITKLEGRNVTVELVSNNSEHKNCSATLINQDTDKRTKELPDLKPIKLLRSSSSNDLIKPFTCTLCPRKFFSEIALQNHSWQHTKEESEQFNENGKLQCHICHKDISTKGNLKVHMETHGPKGKYTCDICGRVFKTPSNLFRHKEYHGSELFTCNVCGRVYPTNSTLRAHSITHSDARPHNCPLCKKTFKRNQDLKFHINQHTGARPYQCPYCDKSFASSGNCFSHRKRMHPLEVERDKDKPYNTKK